jgi:hypothetical protein
MTTRPVALLLAASLAAAGWAARSGVARPLPPADGTAVPVVVELFTSEGCSSCPPADRLLADLVAEQPVAGALVIGLSEHVDYWDRLGWKDPFSDGRYTGRQLAYGMRAGAADVYTPQMVVDGGPGFVGSDRSAALEAVRAAAAANKAPVVLAWADGDRLSVNVAAGAAWANALVMAALSEDGVVSHVDRGENAGRVLSHTGVTRQLSEIGRTDRTGAFARTLTLGPDGSWRRASLHAVVFVQARNAGPILGAAILAFRP